jgi:hypothetical protein
MRYVPDSRRNYFPPVWLRDELRLFPCKKRPADSPAAGAPGDARSGRRLSSAITAQVVTGKQRGAK